MRANSLFAALQAYIQAGAARGGTAIKDIWPILGMSDPRSPANRTRRMGGRDRGKVRRAR